MASRQIVVVDDDSILLKSLGEYFELVAGADCILSRGLDDLLPRQDKILSQSTNLAIVDINLGPNVPSGIDVYHWLRSSGFKGEIVFLTGHAKNHPLVQQAATLGNARVFEKPLDVSALLDLVGGSA